ncbi:BTAD domain-containing putative transcriptional regulator [Streptomyces sp. NPDC015220]|uniref:AfsR/SARP family transcriptional regulator n=1 Tax=Streptomyces sp. NPDC015220 TaxID=3364947 RepID=UPI0036F6075A
MAVRFGILGAIAVWRDGVPVDVGHARQRGVLGALLAEADGVVPADVLVDRVWGEGETSRGREALYGYVSRLRRVLSRVEVDILRDQGGYRLNVSAGSVDVHRFRGLADQSRAVPDEERSAVLWEEALSLWRGQAYAGMDTPWFNAQRDFLDRERLAAQLDLADIRLRRGQHDRILAELFALAEAHPLDERVAGQLMLALYRAGRAAEALARYQDVRRRLAEELGADPGPSLQHLHQQILINDESLTLTVPVPAVAPAVGTGTVCVPVPRQLPAPPTAFTGRKRELEQLTAAVEEAARREDVLVISAIVGTGGIGKTWLALRWAHENLKRFPDGQLYAALRGFDPSAEPVPAQVVIRGFLQALGVPPEEVPTAADAAAGLYRSLVADRRMLIVLDNARDTAQVVPLLPGSPACTVLVTSRGRLDGLATAYGARPLRVDSLTEPEAHQLLADALGGYRLAAEPDAAPVLLRHCAGLPLALGIVAARATAHPDFPLTVLATELNESTTRLDALNTGEVTADLRAVFEASTRALDDEVTRVFGLLGLAPGPDIGLHAAACLTALPPRRTRLLLRGLENAHLIQQYTPSRYRMHDLVRLCAAEHGRDQPAAVQRPALRRLVDFYLHTAHAADRLLHPHRTPIDLDPPVPGGAPYRIPDRSAALRWFDTDHSCLLAAQQLALEHRWYAPAWQLAWALDTFHNDRGYHQDAQAAWRTALTAGEDLGPTAQAQAHQHLGFILPITGSSAQARHHLDQALDLFAQTGDTAGQARTHVGLGMAGGQHAPLEQELPHYQRALRLYQALGDLRRQGSTLNMVGYTHAELGDFRQARTYCEQALLLLRRHGDRRHEAATLDTLGYIAYHTGDHHQALGYYHRALNLSRDIDNAYSEAMCLDHLGQVHQALGQSDEARRVWTQALDLYSSRYYDPAEAQRLRTQLRHLSSPEQSPDSPSWRDRECPINGGSGGQGDV